MEACTQAKATILKLRGREEYAFYFQASQTATGTALALEVGEFSADNLELNAWTHGGAEVESADVFRLDGADGSLDIGG